MSGAEEVLCLFCGHAIAADLSSVSCQKCATPYHEDCWEWIGRSCQRLGCGRSAAVPEPAPAQTLMQSSASRLHLSTLATPAALRIDPRQIVSDLGPMRRNVPLARQASLAWRHWPTALVFGALAAMGMGYYVQLACSALQHAMGATRYQALWGVPWIAQTVQAPLIWAAIGGFYGLLHHRHVRGRAGALNHRLRLLICLLVLPATGFLLGHLLMLPAFYGSQWSLPLRLMLWGPIVFAVIGAIAATAVAWSAPISTDSVFTIVFALTVGTAMLALAAAWNALVTGYLMAWAWLVGAFVASFPFRWLFGFELTAGRGYELGCTIGATIGFVTGITAALQQKPRT